MRKNILVMILAIATSVLFACGVDETADSTGDVSTTEVTGTGGASDLSPITAQTWIDDVTLGSELAADGSMVTGRTGDDFAPGQPIHLTMEVGDAPPGSEVKVIWFGPNETTIGEESKPTVTGQSYLNFTAADTASWALGDYRAEVWIADEKVNTQQFQIVNASEAAN